MSYLKIKTLILLIGGLCLLPLSVYSQSFSDLETPGGKSAFEDKMIKVFWRSTHVNAKHTKSYGGWTFNVGIAANKPDRWAGRFRYENPTLGDMFFVLARTIKNKPYYGGDGSEQSFGSGFLGWFQWYTNVVASDRLIISPGLSLGDYIFGSRRLVPGQGTRIYEPAGYYMTAGPGVLATYLIGAGFWVDGYANYDIPYAKVGNLSSGDYVEIEDYPKPHFLNIGVDIHHSSCFFGGFRVGSAFDRGIMDDGAKRLDISLGMIF